MKLEDLITELRDRYPDIAIKPFNECLFFERAGKDYDKISYKQVNDKLVVQNYKYGKDNYQTIEIVNRLDLAKLYQVLDAKFKLCDEYYNYLKNAKLVEEKFAKLKNNVLNILGQNNLEQKNLTSGICSLVELTTKNSNTKILYRLECSKDGFIASIIDGEDTTDYYADSEFDEFMAELKAKLHNKFNEKE